MPCKGRKMAVPFTHACNGLKIKGLNMASFPVGSPFPSSSGSEAIFNGCEK
jgi:hypothetical protein